MVPVPLETDAVVFELSGRRSRWLVEALEALLWKDFYLCLAELLAWWTESDLEGRQVAWISSAVVFVVVWISVPDNQDYSLQVLCLRETNSVYPGSENAEGAVKIAWGLTKLSSVMEKKV
jgi:hypothetical protein